MRRSSFYVALSCLLGLSLPALADVKFWNPPTLFDTRDFSQVGVEREQKRVIYLSAQGPVKANEKLEPGTPSRVQVRRMLENIDAALKAVGATPAHVVSIHTYVANYKFMDGISIGREMRNFFGNRMPVSTFVPVERLIWPNAKVQSDMVVVLPE
jgi:enamine deaminase RidA (YjgF/YER057c/UK114 family)